MTELRVLVDDLSKAKQVAGEWVAMFNQFEQDNPMIVRIIPLVVGDDPAVSRYAVTGRFLDNSEIGDEDALNAVDVLHDFEEGL
jgi:hypothetical protein